jgi:hypothetical protein
MKPRPPPNVPGNTEAERMSNAVPKMFSVSNGELVKQEAKWKQITEYPQEATQKRLAEG